MDEALETAWEEVDHDWEDEKAHQRFIALCVALDRLPEAGARYREVREARPDRAEAAQRHIESLLAKATAALELHRTEPSPDGRRKLTLVATVISLTMILLAAWLFLRIG